MKAFKTLCSLLMRKSVLLIPNGLRTKWFLLLGTRYLREEVDPADPDYPGSLSLPLPAAAAFPFV
jgi:hypothetical protein